MSSRKNKISPLTKNAQNLLTELNTILGNGEVLERWNDKAGLLLVITAVDEMKKEWKIDRN